MHSTARCFRSRRSTCVGVSTPIDSWAVFGLFMGKAEREAPGEKRTELNKVDDDMHVIVIGKRSWKLRRCLNFSVQCFRPAKRWDFMRKSRVISVHRMCWRVIPTTRGLRSARNASAAHKANHTIEYLDLRENAIGDDGAVALADAIKALLIMCASPGT